MRTVWNRQRRNRQQRNPAAAVSTWWSRGVSVRRNSELVILCVLLMVIRVLISRSGWVLISRCCLLLEKNVVCMVVCSRFGNVSTVPLRQVRFRLRDVRPSRQPAHGPSTRFLVRWPMSSASLRGAHSPQLVTHDPSAGRLTLRPHDL